MAKANVNSKWYPYNKVYEGFYDLSQTPDIPRKITDYILDMPDGVYTPKDDNNYPRTRFWKYLYYDGLQPLNKELPTPKQKKEVLFDPDNPETPPDTEKGYRLIPQYYSKPSQTDAQTRIYVYMGRTIADNDGEMQLSVVFDIWTHFTEELSTKTDVYSRVFALEQCIIEMLHGINIAGCGTFYLNRSKHADCGSKPITDRNSNIGRQLVLGLSVKSETINGNEPFNETPLGDTGLFIG